MSRPTMRVLQGGQSTTGADRCHERDPLRGERCDIPKDDHHEIINSKGQPAVSHSGRSAMWSVPIPGREPVGPRTREGAPLFIDAERWEATLEAEVEETRRHAEQLGLSEGDLKEVARTWVVWASERGVLLNWQRIREALTSRSIGEDWRPEA